MTFSEKLKQAMQELHLNQRQVCGMTGKSKGWYLSNIEEQKRWKIKLEEKEI